VKRYRAADGLWHIDNVPLCATGIEYPLASGPHTFTEQELADAVQAATSPDSAIHPPRLKLGHRSEANQFFLGEDEPAFGRVENLSLSKNKQTVYGDFVGMPDWLAEVLPNAYPSRSVDAQLNVTTATGKRYAMVIADVSLLGVTWPGCSVIEDLPMWYGSERPDDAEIAASMDVTHIRQKFYNDGPGKDNWEWWIRGERFDTEEGYNLIVDEGTGEISRISVAVDGDEVKFGEPVRVIEQYPDKTVAASAVLAGMKMADPSMIIHASRVETDRPRNTTQEEAMDEDLRLSLAKRLGLPEDATEEQIRSKLAEPVDEETPAEGDDDQPDQDDGGDGEGDDAGDGEEQPAEGEPATATVTLDRATFNELKRGAALAASHEKDRQTSRITDMVEAAVKDGRIPPARREHWKKLAAADYEGTKTTLASLEAGLVPVKARGSAGSGDEGTLEQGQGLPEEWFPEIKAIRAQASKDRRIVNAKEG